jgi:chorismate synthase
MAALAHPQPVRYTAVRGDATHRGGTLRAAVLTTLVVAAGALAISVLMTLSIVLAGPLPSSGGVPQPQPLPQPSAIHGLDR